MNSPCVCYDLNLTFQGIAHIKLNEGNEKNGAPYWTSSELAYSNMHKFEAASS